MRSGAILRMTYTKRAFIFGAGFSKPAGMPLATELLPLLADKLRLDEMREWIEGLRKRLAWLSGAGDSPDSFTLNIEQVFHFAHFDREVFRLQQHLEPVGREDGPGTSWNTAESISAWLSYMEEALCDVIIGKEREADLSKITRWAETVNERDTVLTFNYDTLPERSLTNLGKPWNHGTEKEGDAGIAICKLHGSIDWIVADRLENFSKLDKIFEKENANRSENRTGHVEDDCCLWRCRDWDQLEKWIKSRHLQAPLKNGWLSYVGIAGLGAYKQLHQIPGLGQIWIHGMQALHAADVAIVVGFSMSDFDAMAQLQFAEVARARAESENPLKVVVVDPYFNSAARVRFQRVFRTVEFVEVAHESFDWENCR